MRHAMAVPDPTERPKIVFHIIRMVKEFDGNERWFLDDASLPRHLTNFLSWLIGERLWEIVGNESFMRQLEYGGTPKVLAVHHPCLRQGPPTVARGISNRRRSGW